MEHGMLMGASSISLFFACIILVICVLIVIDILVTMWRHQNQLWQLRKEHSTLLHSLSMSLGMISTLTICTIVGAIISTYNTSASYITGMIIGIFISGIISFQLKDQIAFFDGIISGVMGGLMGVMLAFMIPKTGLYTISVFLIVLFVFTWGIMRGRIKSFSSMESLKKMGNQSEKTEISELGFKVKL